MTTSVSPAPSAPPAPPAPPIRTLADLVERLGFVPLERIRFHPFPGTATEDDVLAGPNGGKPLCELVDGVLVEKTMGYYESRVAAVLIRFLETFLEDHDLGIVLGEGGTLKLAPGLVRVPDVSFLAWDHFPNRELPEEPMPALAPDIAVEVLSKGNTREEMERKLREYFATGTRLAWYVEPIARTVRVYTSPSDSTLLSEEDTLDGGDVLPGFRLPLSRWFDQAGRRRGG